VASAAFIVYALTLPFDFVWDEAVAREHLALAVERSAISAFARAPLPDLVQNVLLFIPFGIFGAASMARRQLVAPVVTLVLASILSASCEVLQLFTIDRTTSIWDVAANVSGTAVGCATWLVLSPLSRRAWRRAQFTPDEAGRVFQLACSILLICVATLEPFDFTLDVGSVWSKLKLIVQGEVFVWQPVTDELLTGLRFAVLAALLINWLDRSGRRSPGSRWTAFAVGSAMAISLEMTQFVIASRAPALQDVIAGICGALAGTVVGPKVLASGVAVPLLIILTVAAAVPFYLQPFDFAAVHGAFGLTPFLAYYQFTTLQTLSHVIGLVLIYAPVGFAIEQSKRRHGATIAVLLTMGIATGFEYSQGWIAGRYPDITDVGVAVLGTLTGFALARYGVNVLNADTTGVRHAISIRPSIGHE
jgi:glycopeptide antibiotics resistance protein